MENRSVYGVLVGIPEQRRPLRQPRHREEDNIKIDRRVCIGFIQLRIWTNVNLF
jgi:hypothetical protein